MAKKTPRTKTEILAALAEAGEISKKQAGLIYDELLKIAYAGAKDKKGFVLPGIGKLIKKDRKARWGRNPSTGEKIKIAAKKVVKFTVCKACKDAILAK